MGLLSKWFGKSKPEPMRPLHTQPAPAKAEEKKPESAQPESAQTQPEPVQPEPVQPEPVQPEPAQPIQETPPAGDTISGGDTALQKQLTHYFERLRELYPEGTITRLNTGHKKLAERGAQLRRRLGMEGDLDGFFALGGFTYQRTAGGRPRQCPEDEAALKARVTALFPEGVPSLTALRDADHRLYLDLRALTRRQNVTVGDWLKKQEVMA